MTTKYYLLTPASLDIEKMLAENPTNQKLSPDFLRYVIHLVIAENKYAFQIAKAEREKRGFDYDLIVNTESFKYRAINLSSVLLRKVRYDYEDHMKWLLRMNIVTRRPYAEGQAFGYRLTPKYQNDFLQINAVQNYQVKSKIIKVLNRHSNKLAPELKFLENHLKSDRLTAKLAAALNDLGNDLQAQKITYGNYILSIVGLVQIHNGTIRISQKHSTDGRLHTNVTQLPKIARQYLKYDGKTLVEVDLSSSIPFILAAFLHSVPTVLEQSSSHVIIHHCMLQKSAESIAPVELQEFSDLTIAGELYRTLQDDMMKHLTVNELERLCRKTLNEELTGEVDQVLKIAKKGFLSMLFGKNSQFVEVQHIVEKRFPTILKWVRDFKQWGKGSKRYKRLAHLLFQVESYYMLHVVSKTFNKHHRGRVGIFTLHDCLITTEEHTETLVAIIQRSFQQHLGIVPSLKAVVWDAEGETTRYLSPSCMNDYDRISREIDIHLALAS